VIRQPAIVAVNRSATEHCGNDLKSGRVAGRAVIETELTVKKGRDLVLDGYEFNKLCFVKDGFAARYKLLRNGKRQIVNFLLPGDVVGLPGSFFDRTACSVIAVTGMELPFPPNTSSISAAAPRWNGWRISCSKSIAGRSRSGAAKSSLSTCRSRRR
jgi:hypothetical protein